MLPVKQPIAFSSAVATLHAACFPNPWTHDEVRALLSLPTTILWITDKAFLMCSKTLDEMEILTIGVLPEYRQQHIASAFLQSLLEYAEQNRVQRIFLEVSVTNLPARALYNRFDFREIGQRKGYYQTPQGAVDALCLKREISQK